MPPKKGSTKPSTKKKAAGSSKKAAPKPSAKKAAAGASKPKKQVVNSAVYGAQRLLERSRAVLSKTQVMQIVRDFLPEDFRVSRRARDMIHAELIRSIACIMQQSVKLTSHAKRVGLTAEDFVFACGMTGTKCDQQSVKELLHMLSGDTKGSPKECIVGPSQVRNLAKLGGYTRVRNCKAGPLPLSKVIGFAMQSIIGTLLIEAKLHASIARTKTIRGELIHKNDAYQQDPSMLWDKAKKK